MRYTVYILHSYSCLKCYTGQTQDFDNRVMEHNRGETSSIKACVPWRLVWKKEVGTRSEAVKSEKKIKSRGAARLLADAGITIA